MEEETPELADEGMEVTNDQEPYAPAQQTKIFEELLTCSWRQVEFQNGITSMAVLKHAIMRSTVREKTRYQLKAGENERGKQ